MSFRHHLLGAASVQALALLVASSALAQQSLPTIDVGAARGAARPGRATAARTVSTPRVTTPAGSLATSPNPDLAAAPGFSPQKLAMPVYRQPTGQTFTTVRGKDFETMPLVSVRELLQYSPGVSFKQGNGPRDIVVSIRGSSARNGFGVRNIVMLEDGFSVTQPDGLSRTDLTDPHAYAGVDVYRGPSSALFGNFANGGAINFRTRTGAEIDGLEYGAEFGSFGYLNNYTAIGKKVGNVDIAVFASDVRSQGFTLNNYSDTQTVNATARWQVTPDDLITFKFIHNQLYGLLSSRLSLNQYYLNPYQMGCYVSPQTGDNLTIFQNLCGTINVPRNGVNGVGAINQRSTPWLAGLQRNDRRDIIAARWEHDFDANTKWRTQVIYDDKDISQPTSNTAALGDEPAINASTDITKVGSLGNYEARHFAGLYFNRTRYTSWTLNTLPFGNGGTGAVQSVQNAMMQNLGGRGREEVALSKDVTMVLGLSAEMTKIAALQDAYTYYSADQRTGQRFGQLATWTGTPVNKTYWNFGPEASVTWRATPELLTHFRASSGYGTPNPGQLFVNQQGRVGANTDLKTQRNTGLDMGLDWKPYETLLFSLTGFYEWYQNEQLTQSPGAGLLNYTFNAPGSVHRGVETLLDWRPYDGVRLMANYTYNNQIFTEFVEQIGTATKTGYFDRAGYKIPGVAPHNATARASYDVPVGDFKGLGAFVEYNYQSSYYIDNGNVLTIPSFGVVNTNVHFDRDLDIGPLKRFTAYFEVRNIFDRTWVASANNISNSVSLVNGTVVQNGWWALAQNATGSIYAGNPRLFQGGVKFKF
ncbi:TonB-dependent receptor family protein [Methylocystis echinoides]|uniref:Exported heme receptor protein n=1 Tax=Methylocystis echinoides TaxID=29468 RepID=A0A9W6GVU5_9HYPH|nr:TonB-dependent receptor [Methylocystis echinoides]GLI93873.1 exported heme receptor protein [Methylocystis echinoides]